MNYEHYLVKDFLEDTAFRKWVQSPSAESNAFWQKFLDQHPQKSTEVAQARKFLLALDEHVSSGFVPEEQQKQVFRNIKTQLNQEDERPVRRFFPTWPYWSAAASIVLLLGFWFYGKQSDKSYSYQSNVIDSGRRLVEKVNNGGTPMSIVFADGSKVRLAPASRISFPEEFNAGDKREVFLSGEAFFDVAKNPERPFFVYSNELVTKVLGTSFNIKAYEQDQDITINVTSGKVAVSIAEDAKPAAGSTEGKVRDLLLLPNQQAVLSRKEAELVRSLVKEPVLVKANATHKDFVFVRTPVDEVFEKLKTDYSVQITYDAALFARCELTADLTAESLYEKLDVICKTIEATYKSEDGRIVVTGNGCN
ncbi:FecR family protein [Dyadobacter aurulentus]|uniref:FecR family protein n=1 Tax=Dyadobacter sp. UC 10 TaxID=2605428 RepID=UPI0011F29F87|nr:FecR family protein [Dyadobacter sp. UC 10]KAA0992311.1 DUF4974 domain-containing protein [Dyadobacter sp. UC 10]